MKIFDIAIAAACAALLVAGCATGMTEIEKGLIGDSTKVLDDNLKTAVTKEYDFGIEALEENINTSIKGVPKFSVYARDPARHMIAIYYVDVNTTPVGIYLKETGPNRTLLSVSSPSSNAKHAVSKKLFALLGSGKNKDK